MRSRILPRYALAFTLAGLPGATAHGATGEINQRCVPFGCFAGDGPGFPVTISQPGAYRLTSNLDVTGRVPKPENVTAIEIEAENVDLDLDGFQLLGPTRCPGPATPCSPVGMGVGIFSLGDGSSVHDGSITGFGNAGLMLTGDFRVERVHVWNNGREGLFAAFDHGGLLVDSALFANGGDGAHTGRTIVVTGNIFGENKGAGFHGRAHTQVEESISWANSRDGFRGEEDLNLHYCVATDNGEGGLSGFALASVGADNGTYGVTMGLIGDAIVLRSVLTGNGQGAWAAGGSSLGRNACNGAGC